MTIPGMSSHGLPPNWDSLARRIKQIERRLDLLATARTLENASIGENGITVEAGGSIKFVNADDELLMTIDGTNGLVATPLGLIGNSNLAHLVSAAAGNNDVDSLTPADDAFHTIATATIPVPDDVTAAALTVTAHAGGSTTAGSTGSYLQVAARINDESGHTIAQWLAPGFGSSASASYGVVLTDPVGSIAARVRVAVTSPANITAKSLNGSVSALALFYR